MSSGELTLRFNNDNKFVVVKAVTWEADALRLVSQLPVSPHCMQLLDEFRTLGNGYAGSHMCFVAL